jgi:hypothetical protein
MLRATDEVGLAGVLRPDAAVESGGINRLVKAKD